MAAVPGSALRRVLFWMHLSVGCIAGVLILVMSATGVLLTYQHQLLESAARANHVPMLPDSEPLSADRLADVATRRYAGPVSLVFSRERAAPVAVQSGRETTLLHPVTGEPIADAAAGRRALFRAIEDWHRWLGAERGSLRAAVNPLANLLFLVLLASGAYLWLPAVWRWRTVRGLLLLRSRYVNAKARDFAWHHVFGAWAVLPLLLIVASGVVFSYSWANRAVFAAFGETPPQRGGPPRSRPSDAAMASDATATTTASIEALRRAAASAIDDWERMTIVLPPTTPRIDVSLELETSSARAPRRVVTLDTLTATVVSVSPEIAPGPGAGATPGQHARVWLRFIHTGEQYGLLGQTVAGLGSLAACFLVYTGLALAWRRLLRPLFGRKPPSLPGATG